MFRTVKGGQLLTKCIWYPRIETYEFDKPLILLNQANLDFYSAKKVVMENNDSYTSQLLQVLDLLEEISDRNIFNKFPRIQVFKGLEVLRINNLSVKGKYSVYVDMKEYFNKT